MKISQLFFILAVLCSSQLKASDSWLTTTNAPLVNRELVSYARSDKEAVLWLSQIGLHYYSINNGETHFYLKKGVLTREENRAAAIEDHKLKCVNNIRKMQNLPVEDMTLQKMDQFMESVLKDINNFIKD